MKTRKRIGNAVAFLLAGLSVPVLGNLILIFSTNQLLSTVGCYIYFLGMDFAVYSLWHFTHVYCEMGKPKKWLQGLIMTLLTVDLINYILNPFFGQAFATEKILVENKAYFRLVPHIGQTYHRVFCYGLFLAILILFAVKTIRSSRIYRDKYWVILFSMIVAGAIESYYIFSRKPLDMSMIAFGVFGPLVYFFAIQYRPMKLLDRMLAGIASDMPEALFFFDKSGKCIWTNEPGRNLIGVSKDNYEGVKDNLRYLFGDDLDFNSSGWFKRVTLGTGDETQYTYLAMRSVVDEKNNVTGTYLSVRDITEEQREMKREIYNSTHDSLTGLYTKGYLYEQINKRLEDDHETKYEGFNPDDPESYIFFSLIQNAHLGHSLQFADEVAKSMASNSPVRNNRGISQDPFWVLWRTASPAVLIEVGFMSNPGDLEKLRSEQGREQIARCILDAFKAFKKSFDSSSSIPQGGTPAVSLPAKVLYGTQVLATGRKMLSSDPFFAGFVPMEVKGPSLYKYIIGTSADINEARRLNADIKKKFPDSYMVKIEDGKTSRVN